MGDIIIFAEGCEISSDRPYNNRLITDNNW